MLKEADNQLRMLSYLFKKLNKISLLHRINNLGIQDYCLLNNLLTEIFIRCKHAVKRQMHENEVYCI